MIVSQRLIRKLCDCAEPTSPSPELTEYLQAAGLPTDGIRRPVGCRKCDGSGYAGRRAIFDIVTVSDGLRALLGNGQTTVDDIRAGIESEYGASILAYEGYKLAAAGITSVEEVERVAFDMEKAD